MNFQYAPRNDMVIVALQRPGVVGGLVMPDRAEEGNWWQVVAFVPKVTDLTVGQRVLVGAQPGQGVCFPVPGEKDFLAVEQKFVLSHVLPKETADEPA